MSAILDSLNLMCVRATEEIIFLSWQGSLLICLVLGLTWFLRRGSACLKYALWCLVLAKLLMPFHFSAPTGAVNLISESTVFVSFEPARAVREPVMTMTEPVISEPNIDIDASDVPEALGASTASIAASTAPIGGRFHRGWQNWVGLCWLGGAGFFFMRSLWAYIRLRGLVTRSSEPASEALLAEVADLSRRLNLRRKVRVLVSDSIDGPALMGFLRPRIILPASFFAKLAGGERRAILAHELIHVKRFDHWVLGLEMLVRSLHFFNPLAYLAIARIQSERERACDDRVAALFDGEVLDYTEGLLKVLRFKGGASPRLHGTLALIETRGETSGRIRRLLTPSRRIAPRLSVPALLLLAAAACVVLPGRSNRTASIPDSFSENILPSVNLSLKGMGDIEAKKPEIQVEFTLVRGTLEDLFEGSRSAGLAVHRTGPVDPETGLQEIFSEASFLGPDPLIMTDKEWKRFNDGLRENNKIELIHSRELRVADGKNAGILVEQKFHNRKRKNEIGTMEELRARDRFKPKWGVWYFDVVAMVQHDDSIHFNLRWKSGLESDSLRELEMVPVDGMDKPVESIAWLAKTGSVENGGIINMPRTIAYEEDTIEWLFARVTFIEREGRAPISGMRALEKKNLVELPKSVVDRDINLFGFLGKFIMSSFGVVETEFDKETGKMKRFSVRNDVRLRSQAMNIDCDLFEVDSEKVCVATGNVKLTINTGSGAASVGHADRLVFEADKQKYVFSGNATFNQGGGDKPLIIKAKTITLMKGDGEEWTLMVDPGKKVSPGSFSEVKPESDGVE